MSEVTELHERTPRLSQIVLAIDPGPERSGFILWDGTVIECGTLDNQSLRYRLGASTLNAGLCAIEMIASYGMPVGKEVFETCVWIGRFVERAPMLAHLIYRKDVKMHLCGTPRAKDGNLRAAMIDRFGGRESAIGRKVTPGPLYGVKSHIWAALAVALYAQDCIIGQDANKAMPEVQTGSPTKSFFSTGDDKG